MYRLATGSLRASSLSMARSAPPVQVQTLRMRSAVVGAVLVSGNIVLLVA
jgi:hypothetical protein